MPQAALLRGERVCLLSHLNCLEFTLGGCEPRGQRRSLRNDALLLQRAELPWLHWPPREPGAGICMEEVVSWGAGSAFLP